MSKALEKLTHVMTFSYQNKRIVNVSCACGVNLGPQDSVEAARDAIKEHKRS